MDDLQEKREILQKFYEQQKMRREIKHSLFIAVISLTIAASLIPVFYLIYGIIK